MKKKKIKTVPITSISILLLLQIRESAAKNWGSYYELGQPLLQNRAAITSWGKIYYKLEQVLQIRAIVKNWGIALSVHILARQNRAAFPQQVCVT